MPALIQVDGDQRTSSYPSPRSHLWFHHICNRTPYRGFLIHPVNRQSQNPFLQCVYWKFKVLQRSDGNLLVFVCLPSMANEFSQSFLIIPGCISRKIECDMLFSSLELEKTDWAPFSGVTELYEWFHHFTLKNIHPRCTYGQGCQALNISLGQHPMHYTSSKGRREHFQINCCLRVSLMSYMYSTYNGVCTN